MKQTLPLDQAELNTLFEYKDGVLYNRVNRLRARIGNPVGTTHSGGYSILSLNNRLYKTSRIIHTMHHGTIPAGLVIDHIDGNKLNNKIGNLRAITQYQNCLNTRNVKGYSYNKASDTWHVRLRINGKQVHLGSFNTESEAHEAATLAIKIRNEMAGL